MNCVIFFGALFFAFLVVDMLRDVIKRRLSYRYSYSWLCPICKQEGRHFRFSSNTSMVTSMIAIEHMREFHTTLSAQGGT